MARFSVTRSNVALSTTDDTMTLVTAASRKAAIIEVSIGGMGTASAANELMVQRSTGGATPGGAITPEKLDPDAPASDQTVNTTWVTQPTLSGTPMLRLPVNANGGIYRWVARPGEEIIVRNAGQLSLRSAVGTSNVSVHMVWDET